jgi:hypothetical protein
MSSDESFYAPDEYTDQERREWYLRKLAQYNIPEIQVPNEPIAQHHEDDDVKQQDKPAAAGVMTKTRWSEKVR